ncbi:MAG: hypothetical protein LBS09_05605 [Bacteroidales bacterium]|jgi:hypothetical protein|nr:hypothetical protein [Bacteroidales bacterium]
MNIYQSAALFEGNKRTLHNGFAMKILRSTQTAGTAKIRVAGTSQATPLKETEKTLETK